MSPLSETREVTLSLKIPDYLVDRQRVKYNARKWQIFRFLATGCKQRDLFKIRSLLNVRTMGFYNEDRIRHSDEIKRFLEKHKRTFREIFKICNSDEKCGIDERSLKSVLKHYIRRKWIQTNRLDVDSKKIGTGYKREKGKNVVSYRLTILGARIYLLLETKPFKAGSNSSDSLEDRYRHIRRKDQPLKLLTWNNENYLESEREKRRREFERSEKLRLLEEKSVDKKRSRSNLHRFESNMERDESNMELSRRSLDRTNEE